MADRERLNVRAIILTAVLFWVLAVFAGVAIWAVAEVAGVAPEVLLSAPRSTADLVASSLWSLAWMALAGFVVGHTAGHREVAHAACVGLVLFAVCALPMLLLPSQEPSPGMPWLTVGSWVLALPAALAGGMLARALRVRMRAA